MIKAVIQTVSGPAVILGLSGENITRLMADEPILLDLAEVGLPPQQIVIIAGRTEGDLATDVHELVRRAQYNPSKPTE